MICAMPLTIFYSFFNIILYVFYPNSKLCRISNDNLLNLYNSEALKFIEISEK